MTAISLLICLRIQVSAHCLSYLRVPFFCGAPAILSRSMVGARPLLLLSTSECSITWCSSPWYLKAWLLQRKTFVNTVLKPTHHLLQSYPSSSLYKSTFSSMSIFPINIFTNQANLQIHCCGTGYGIVQRLKDHLQDKHWNEIIRSYVCPFCTQQTGGSCEDAYVHVRDYHGRK